MVRKNIVILCMAAVLVIILSSCRSIPRLFTLDDTVVTSSLSGKTVFLDIGMAEWRRIRIPLVDTAIFYRGLNEIIDEYNVLQAERIGLLHEQLMDYYKNIYSTEMVNDSFSFAEEFDIDIFYEPDDETIRLITEICAKHDAEYVFTIVGQMRTIGVTAWGRGGQQILFFRVVLFDRSGSVITRGHAFTNTKTLRSRDLYGFISLFDDAADALKSLISALGS